MVEQTAFKLESVVFVNIKYGSKLYLRSDVGENILCTLGSIRNYNQQNYDNIIAIPSGAIIRQQNGFVIELKKSCQAIIKSPFIITLFKGTKLQLSTGHEIILDCDTDATIAYFYLFYNIIQWTN